jgi:ABC-type bacteriocin/lantibiotic exporter with double-glycine peptidase domain
MISFFDFRWIHWSLIWVSFFVWSHVLPSSSSATNEGNQPANVRVENIVQSTFNWIPTWRSENDCGPLALYLLMRLNHIDVDVDTVKSKIPIDPKFGCSLADLDRAASQLNFPLQSLYVDPMELKLLKPPFIYHGRVGEDHKSGHFNVILQYNAATKKFKLINQEGESIDERDEKEILHSATGYVLIKRESYLFLSGIVFLIGLAIFWLLFLSTCLLHGTEKVPGTVSWWR